MNTEKLCIKCNGEMRLGTYTGQEINWEKDAGETFLKNKGTRINTYACVKCGFMESYVSRSSI